METHEEDCPLCGKNATFRFVDYANRKEFSCDTCKQFQISKASETVVRSGSRDSAEHLSGMSATEPLPKMVRREDGHYDD
jgi:hypothetical protein